MTSGATPAILASRYASRPRHHGPSVPAWANAAAEVGNYTMYVRAVANGVFTITHANSATTGRVFLWAVVG